jgi:hypothetical protein
MFRMSRRLYTLEVRLTTSRTGRVAPNGITGRVQFGIFNVRRDMTREASAPRIRASGGGNDLTRSDPYSMSGFSQPRWPQRETGLVRNGSNRTSMKRRIE